MTETPRSIHITLPRVTARLDYLRETIVNFLSSEKIDEGTISRIELSAYEAVVNIIEHSSPAYRDRDIDIECTVRDDDVLVVVRNYGEKFDITEAAMPDIEKHYKAGKMRGLGIYFMRTLMDSVEYSHHDMVSTLRMSKKFKPQPGPISHM
jgi:serine/threonine-protein kinase RsbW